MSENTKNPILDAKTSSEHQSKKIYTTSTEEIVLSITDVSDFFQKWPELKKEMTSIIQHPAEAGKIHSIILYWMVELMDKISDDDL